MLPTVIFKKSFSCCSLVQNWLENDEAATNNSDKPFILFKLSNKVFLMPFFKI